MMRAPKLTPSENCDAWWISPTASSAFWRPFGTLNRPDIGNVTVEAKMSYLGAVTLYVEEDQTIIVFDAEHCAASCILDVAKRANDFPKPYVVKYRYDGWCMRVCHTHQNLLNLLSDVFRPSTVISFPTSLRIEPLKDIPEVLLDVVNNTQSWIDELFVFSRGDAGLVYDSIGKAAPAVGMLGEKWRVQTAGKAFDAGFEDAKFDQKTAMAYNEVLMSQKPSFSRVSGAMRAGKDIIYQNYNRVILPLEGPTPRVASLAQICEAVGPPY